MNRFIAGLAFVLCCTFGMTTQSFADTQCKGEVQATGHGAILEGAAKQKAIDAWRNAVVTQYGVFYGDPTKANEGKNIDIVSCGRTLIGLDVCLAKGRPCLAADDNPDEPTIICARGDSPRCEGLVKWVQDRLNVRGARPRLSVDGDPGPGTMAAISSFRRSNGLPDGTTIDKDLIAALRK